MEPEVVVNPIVDDTHDERGWYPDRTRRVAVLWIGEEHILSLFSQSISKEPPSFSIKLVSDAAYIIKDAKILRVTHGWDRCSFGFLLSHPSFDPIPEGCPAPDLSQKYNWEWTTIEEK